MKKKKTNQRFQCNKLFILYGLLIYVIKLEETEII